MDEGGKKSKLGNQEYLLRAIAILAPLLRYHSGRTKEPKDIAKTRRWLTSPTIIKVWLVQPWLPLQHWRQPERHHPNLLDLLDPSMNSYTEPTNLTPQNSNV